MAPAEREILLVEDDADDVALTLHAFQKSELRGGIRVVGDGAQALDYLFGRGEFADRGLEPLPAVVLMDLKLPRLGGLDALRAVRADERTRTLPVVILTASKEDRDMIEGYRLGANSYVRKPVDFVRFARAMRQLGLYWLELNEAPPR